MSLPLKPQRLPAAERRQALINAALRVFAGGSYSGATTAEIAREAGVSEPILYRHFASKRDLYLACLEAAWAILRDAIEAAVAREPDPAEWVMAVPKTIKALRARKALPMEMWMQALTEAGEDPEIRRYLRKHMQEVHDFIRRLLERAQAHGGVPPDRDPDAEAWVMVGIGLLRAVQARLGGIVSDEDFAAIARSRRRWLTGQGLG
jgi:AcrR family transcriptional regulator